MSDVGFRSVMCGLFLAAALGVLLTRRRDRWVTRRAQRFAVETHSWVAGEDCLELERRVVASEPPLGIMLVGLAALTWIPGSGRSGDEVVGLAWVIWLILVLVATMGWGLGPSHPAATTAALVAGDWISRPLRLTAALAVLVPVVGTILRQHQSVDLAARSLGWILAGSMVAGLARWEMLLRRPTESARGAVVEGRTRPLANASWRDAWRGWLLANRCLGLGILSVAISGLSLPRSPSPTPGDSAVDLVLRILSVAVGVALLLAYHHGRVHVRRRLWPDLPPIGVSGSIPGRGGQSRTIESRHTGRDTRPSRRRTTRSWSPAEPGRSPDSTQPQAGPDPGAERVGAWRSSCVCSPSPSRARPTTTCSGWR